MRVTQILLKQHIGWHFQKHWRFQGKRRVNDTGAEKVLKEKGIPVEDANAFLKEKIVRERVEVVSYGEKVQPLDKTHPNWHDRKLLTYKDNNVLLEGLIQAQILTNTVQIQEGLPAKYELPEIKKELNRRIKEVILGAHILDAEQKKLPKLFDPLRPAFNFPRVYGVTQNRVFKLLVSRLLNLVETTSDINVTRQRYLADNLYFSYPFERNGDLIQFQLQGDTVLLAKNPLAPITRQPINELDLPDIFPIKPTVTLNEENIYVVENIYPVKKNAPKYHPHTLFINYDKEFVRNIFEEEVTTEQIYGRTLLKTFTAAASYARAQYGEDIKKLPQPVTLQAVQTDGRIFYFGVLQLNTLDLESPEIKNVWYQTAGIDLFQKCCYELGKPVLEGYNKEAIKHLFAFYNNV
ncbi:39S ribosomal protein L37, mitochondrial [Anthonomus grandis grandis]|uniref:39S ribosomal protein L37, mitochondrial n=1 Tax=Anthonomus grandis grandis TaxID=2921223 RepID=UPI0021659C13|nr:39S ribosomal protein L37, mitochondrial [Anthonomus grandis grandis]XP_050294809.1 39S ribosomal protein L37, mitochondrial [Anthonomus grandis grandis]